MEKVHSSTLSSLFQETPLTFLANPPFTLLGKKLTFFFNNLQLLCQYLNQMIFIKKNVFLHRFSPTILWRSWLSLPPVISMCIWRCLGSRKLLSTILPLACATSTGVCSIQWEQNEIALCGLWGQKLYNVGKWDPFHSFCGLDSLFSSISKNVHFTTTQYHVKPACSTAE